MMRPDGEGGSNLGSLTHGLWGHTAPPAPPTPTLRSTERTDVAIIGAGYTGLSAALHLRKAGLEAAVLEAREIGFGASGRNVGLVNAGLWTMPDEVAEALGDRGEALLSLLSRGPGEVFDLIERHGIACEAVRSGTLHCALGPEGVAELRERERQWSRRGAPVQLLDAAETSRRVGSHAYDGALLDPRAGTIQPLAYARGLARAALDTGARIFTDSPVVSAAREGGGWALSTPTGALRAETVIVATDAYAGGVFGEIRAELVHLPYFNMATAPLPKALLETILPGRQGAWDTAAILSSFRLDDAGRLVFGSVGALRGPGRAIHADWGRRALGHLFPQLGRVSFESEWYGQIGMTQDALPRFHRLAPDVVSISGYNGRGIAPGTVFGRLLAELVSGALDECDLPLAACAASPVRLRRAREAYYEVGAQLAHLSGARRPVRR